VASPSPDPPPNGFVVKNGSNAAFLVSESIPGPESLTQMAT
jgi:hypothetical protein